MLIGISGKIGSGKDTVGRIIQYFTSTRSYDKTFEEWEEISKTTERHYAGYSSWEIKKFADILKDIVCMLIGCTREQLEDHEFKNTELGEDWTYYAYADGHNEHYRNGTWTKSMNSVPCSKEKYEEEKRINWQTAYKTPLTPRLLLQLLGTECGRNIIHPNIWVNALFADYNKICSQTKTTKCRELNSSTFCYNGQEENRCKHYPNWIITDMRFPNEKEAVEKRRGVTIRVNRPKATESIGMDIIDMENNQVLESYRKSEHPSETALDNSTFNYTIENNGTIEELVDKVREILIKEKIITNG